MTERKQEMCFVFEETHVFGTGCAAVKAVTGIGLGDSKTSTPPARRCGGKLQRIGSACDANGSASVDQLIGSVLSMLLPVGGSKGLLVDH